MSERERERRAQQSRDSAAAPPDPWSARAAKTRIKPITLTIADAAEITGLGVSTIWRLIKNGKLDTTSVGRRRLIFFASLEALLSKDAAA
jgi:excisionase family DNA binding protein